MVLGVVLLVAAAGVWVLFALAQSHCASMTVSPGNHTTPTTCTADTGAVPFAVTLGLAGAASVAVGAYSSKRTRPSPLERA